MQPVVRPPYAIWSFRALYRYDLTTGQTITVSPDAYGGDLRPDGEVVYISDGDVLRYRDGATTHLTHGGAVGIPITDGTGVVYRKDSPGRSEAWMYDGTREIRLGELQWWQPRERSAYGWVVYVQQNPNSAQVWRRTPGDASSPVGDPVDSMSAASLHIVALADSGAVVYTHDDQLLLAERTGPPILLAAGLGGSSGIWRSGVDLISYVDGRLNLAIGGSLYALTDPTPAGSGSTTTRRSPPPSTPPTPPRPSSHHRTSSCRLGSNSRPGTRPRCRSPSSGPPPTPTTGSARPTCRWRSTAAGSRRCRHPPRRLRPDPHRPDSHDQHRPGRTGRRHQPPMKLSGGR